MQDNCERIEDLPAFTASHPTHLLPTFLPFYGLQTTTINLSRNGTILVYLCYSFLRLVYIVTDIFFFHFSDISHMPGATPFPVLTLADSGA